jgi:hypothetical protein
VETPEGKALLTVFLSFCYYSHHSSHFLFFVVSLNCLPPAAPLVNRRGWISASLFLARPISKLNYLTGFFLLFTLAVATGDAIHQTQRISMTPPPSLPSRVVIVVVAGVTGVDRLLLRVSMRW